MRRCDYCGAERPTRSALTNNRRRVCVDSRACLDRKNTTYRRLRDRALAGDVRAARALGADPK